MPVPVITELDFAMSARTALFGSIAATAIVASATFAAPVSAVAPVEPPARAPSLADCTAVERALVDSDLFAGPSHSTLMLIGHDAEIVAERVAGLLGYPTIEADLVRIDRSDAGIDVLLIASDLCIVAGASLEANAWEVLFPQA